MKQRFLAMLLALCMTLSFLPAALAEEETYLPGSIMNSLLTSAFDAGQILTADLSVSMDADPAAFGMEDEDDKAQFEAILSLIKDATLSLGAGKLDDGLRIELGAAFSPEGTSGASVSAAADVTLDGISVESDLIAGNKVTATWETLFALAGVDSDTSAAILSLRDMDWEAALAEAAGQLEAALSEAVTLALPYAQTVAKFVAALPIQTDMDVAEDDAHPAAAQRITITFTRDDVRKLITTLADQLEQDEQLAPKLDALLAQITSSDDDVPKDTAALCAAIRDEARELTGAEPYTFVAGLDADSIPLYIEITGQLGSGLYLSFYPVEGTQVFECTLISYEDDGELEFGLSLAGAFVMDEVLSQASDLFVQFQLLDEDDYASMNYAYAIRPMTAENGQPGYTLEGSTNVSVSEDDDLLLNETVSTQAEWAKTPTGGEAMNLTASTEIAAEGTQTTMTMAGSISMEPTEDGFTGLYVISEQMPEMGIKDMTFSMALGAHEHDAAASAALTPLALESATSEEVNALITQCAAAAQQKLFQLLSVLPQDIQVMLMNAE